MPPVKSRNLFPPPAKRNQANGQIHPELLDGYTYMLDGDRTVDTAVQELKEAFSPQAIFDSAERRLIKLNPGTTQDLHAYISVGYNQFGADARAVAFKILVTDTEQTAGTALLCAEGYFIATTCKGLDLVIAMDNISQDVYLAGELFSQGWPRRNGTFTLFTQLIVHPDLRSPVLHDLMLELEGVSAHYRRTSQLSPRGSCWFSTGILSRPTCCWSSAVSAPFTNNGTNSACSASQRNLSSPIDPAHAPLASEFASSGSTLALNRPPPLPAGSHPLGSRRQPLSAYQSDLRSPCPFAIALSISSTRNPTGTRRHSASRDAELEHNEAADNLLADLNDAYNAKATKGWGLFHGQSGAYPLSGWLSEYLDGGQDFVSFSRQAAEHLVRLMEESSLTVGAISCWRITSKA